MSTWSWSRLASLASLALLALPARRVLVAEVLRGRPLFPKPVSARARPRLGLREAKKELTRIDRQVQRLSSRESELHEALAKAAADYAKLIALGDELKALQAEKADLEDRWLELAEETAS